MATKVSPVIGQWYKESGRSQVFRVTDLDEDSVEIEYQDGDVEQIAYAEWDAAKMRQIAEPESLDSFSNTFDLEEGSFDNRSWEDDYPDLVEAYHAEDD